jgi:hypothetical protein
MKILALFLLLLAACTPAAGPTAAAIPSAIPTRISTSTVAPTVAASDTLSALATPIPTFTSTPVPSLVAHDWSQNEPVVTMNSTWFDGYCGFEDAYPIDFMLFPNGELYVVRRNDKLKADQIQTTVLSRQATCNLLNSIDQAGFFDYDPATYVRDPLKAHWPVMGAPSTQISVEAWRTNSVDLYALGWFTDPAQVEQMKKDWEPECGPCPDLDFPTILPALRKTSELLVQYRPADLHLYEPGRLGVWVVQNGEQAEAIEWPLKSKPPALFSTSSEFAGKSPNMILTGADAAIAFKTLGKRFSVCGMSVTEGDAVYRAFARPLLPNEFNSSPLPKVSLSCSPSDGWIQAP